MKQDSLMGIFPKTGSRYPIKGLQVYLHVIYKWLMSNCILCHIIPGDFKVKIYYYPKGNCIIYKNNKNLSPLSFRKRISQHCILLSRPFGTDNSYLYYCPIKCLVNHV